MDFHLKEIFSSRDRIELENRLRAMPRTFRTRYMNFVIGTVNRLNGEPNVHHIRFSPNSELDAKLAELDHKHFDVFNLYHSGELDEELYIRLMSGEMIDDMVSARRNMLAEMTPELLKYYHLREEATKQKP